MTATVSGPGSTPAPLPGAPGLAGAHVTFPRVVRAEALKLRSLRSTWWTVAATVVLIVGFAVLIAFGITSSFDQMSAHDRATFDPTNVSLAGFTFGQLSMAVLGVLTIGSEYSTGGIRSTLVAVPRRLQVLGAKAVVLATVALLVGLACAFVAFFAAQPIYATKGVGASISDPHVVRALVGSALYLVGTAMFGLALGTLLRHTAGGITAAVALLFVLPPLTNLLPGDWGAGIRHWFTYNAASNLVATRGDPSYPGVWTGFAGYCAEWAVVLAAAALLMRRRDA